MKSIDELRISPHPWEMNDLGSAVINATGDDVIVPICCDDLGRRDGRLIAAAPDLYAALSSLVAFCEDEDGGLGIDELLDVCREALAKAGGAE